MATSVHQFLCLTDNYGVLLHNSSTGSTASIDAPEAGPILAALKEKGWTLTHLLITHHHADHVQGPEPELKAQFPSLKSVGPAKDAARIGFLDTLVSEGDEVRVGALGARVIEAPGPYARPYRLSFRGGQGWRHLLPATRSSPSAVAGRSRRPTPCCGARSLSSQRCRGKRRSIAGTNTPRPTRASR